MITPQDFVHKLETTGSRLRLVMILLALVLLAAGYNWFSYRNMATQSAMDSAQVARNLSEGKGFTTQLLRPLSLYLVKQQRFNKPGTADDLYLVKTAHPDISNPPVYPVMLAGLMKVLPFRFEIPQSPGGIWGGGDYRFRYQPDFLIALFNEAIFFLCIFLVFRLGKRLFDENVAFFSALVMLGTELFWKFSVSGLSTMLLMLLFLLLTWVLVLAEAEGREPKHGPKRPLSYAAAAGALAGLCGLTRYSFLWIILPVGVFLMLWGGGRRWLNASVAVAAFFLVVSPWVARNWMVSGLPLGTATYTLAEGPLMGKYAEHRLARAIDPKVSIPPQLVPYKLIQQLRGVISNDVPKFAGNWVAGLCLLALLMSYNNPALSRVRFFLLGALLLMILIQSLGKTQLSEDVPEVNVENLLVVLAPLVILFGVAMFYVVLDTIQLPIPELRRVIVVGFGFLLCLPMLLTFLPPRSTYPLVYPPYFPPQFQACASYTKTNELVMCDLPWAMAWYGQRQTVWLPADGYSDFFTINDSVKPVAAFFLTRQIIDGKLFSQHLNATGADKTWGELMMNIILDPPKDRDWPKEIRFGIPRGDGTRIRLPFDWWQPGWPDMLLLTTRKQPL